MQTKTVKVTAHRGASAAAPENTQSAIEKAIQHGAHMIEIDVHMSRDGQVVLLHDDRLDRTTGKSAHVWDLTLREIQQLDAGSWFGPEFTGEKIPTLKAVLQLTQGRAGLNIEIKKSGHEPGIAGIVADLIKAKKRIQDCIVTSFDRDAILAIKTHEPRIRTGFIFARSVPNDAFDGPWDVLSTHHDLVDSSFIRRAHAADKKVHVWTVNDPELMRRLVDLGVDNIITNEPALLIQVLRKGKNQP